MQQYANLTKAADDVDDANVKAEALEGQLASRVNTNTSFIDILRRQIKLQDIVALAGGLSQIAFSIQSIQNLGAIWSDDDLSSVDKMLQTVLSISITLPMVLTGAQELVQGIKAIRAAIVEFAAVKKGLDLADGASSFAALGTAATASTAGVTGLTASVTGLRTALMSISPWVAILGAIAAALGGGLYLAWQEFTKDARAAEEMAEASSRAAEAARVAQTEYDNLQGSIENYHSAVSAVNELTQGTEEWKDAIVDANEQVISLLDSYPELAKYVNRTSGGLLTIDESGLSELTKLQEEQMLQLQAVDTIQKNRASQAQTQLDRTELRRGITYQDTATYQGQTTRYTATLSDGQLDSVLNMIRTQGEQSLQSEQSIADALSVDVGDPIVAAVKESADRIIQFNSQAEANHAAERIRSEQMAQSLLNAQEGYDSSAANNDALVSAVANAADQDSTAFQEALKGVQEQDFSSILKQYQDLTGDSYSEVNDDFFNNNNDKAQFESADGTAYTVTRQDIEAALATAQVMESVAADWQNIANQVEQVQNTDLAQQYEGLSSTIFSADAENGFDFKNLSNRELLELSGLNITAESLGMTDELAEEMGYSNAQAYVDAFTQQIQQATEGQRTLQDLFSGNLSENDDFYSLSEEDQKQYIIDNAQSINDLDQAYSQGLINQYDYSRGLSQLASQFPELSEKINEATEAQEAYVDAEIEAQDAQDELERLQNDVTASDEDRADALKDLRKQQEEATDASFDMLDAQAELEDAYDTKVWAKARDELADYADILKDGDKESEDYQRAIQKVTSSLSDISGYKVDTSWVQENQQAVQDWLNGIEGAGAKLYSLLSIDLEFYKAILMRPQKN